MKNIFDNMLLNGLQDEINNQDSISLLETVFYGYRINKWLMKGNTVWIGLLKEKKQKKKKNVIFIDNILQFEMIGQEVKLFEKTAYAHSFRKIHYFLEDHVFFLATCCSELYDCKGYSLTSFRQKEKFSITMHEWVKTERNIWVYEKKLFQKNNFDNLK